MKISVLGLHRCVVPSLSLRTLFYIPKYHTRWKEGTGRALGRAFQGQSEQRQTAEQRAGMKIQNQGHNEALGCWTVIKIPALLHAPVDLPTNAVVDRDEHHKHPALTKSVTSFKP